MVHNHGFLFDIVHSLPVVHSVALSTRTPSAGFSQVSKYIPDYGGVLETPTSAVKNNALSKGFPFNPIASTQHIKRQLGESSEEVPPQEKVSTQDCLVVSSYLDSTSEGQYSAIRAVGNDLYFDLINCDRTAEHVYTSSQYCHRSLPGTISGIKHSEDLQELLLVKFAHGVKTLKLNKSYQTSEDTSSQPINEINPVYKLVSSISEKSGLSVKDACLNRFNKSIQSVACDSSELFQVQIHDLSVRSSPFQSISWNPPNVIRKPEPDERVLRRRTVRTFIPKGPAQRGIQQLDNIPSHLVNLLTTTSNQIILIDPRQDQIAQVYVDKATIPSFYPIEFLRRTEFSLRNSFQLYSLSNIHCRVFDTRYPGTPVNQINHMLDSDHYNNINLKLIQYEGGNLETLSCSSPDRLCFMTFDQTQPRTLINPKSIHLPYHETTHDMPISDDGAQTRFGLSVKLNRDSSNGLFSVFQLLADSSLLIKSYSPAQEENFSNLKYETGAEVIVKQDHQYYISGRKVSEANFIELDEPQNPDSSGSEKEESEKSELINILDSTLMNDLEARFESRRALERFQKMKNKLNRL